MTPLSFEWQWDTGHIIFMGLLYLVLLAVAFGLLTASVRTWLDLHRGKNDGLPPVAAANPPTRPE